MGLIYHHTQLLREKSVKASVQGHTVPETSGCAGGSFCSLVDQGGPGPLKLTRAPGKSLCKKGGPEALGEASSSGSHLASSHLPSLLA